MGKDFAKFMATTANKIVFGDKDVELKLTIPHKVAQQNLEFLTSSLNKEIHVILGDPQMAFDFEEDEEDMYRVYRSGRRVTADASGVVTTVEQPDEQKDENQAELALEEPGSEDGVDHSEGQAVDPAGEQPPAEEEDELNDYEREIMGEDSTQKESDLPEWMQEQQHEQSEGQEMSFEEADQEPAEDGTSDPEESQASSDEEISKEELEEYILAQRPSFPDHPLDFPELLKRKRTEEVTWRELANSVGMTSGQLNGKYAKYKEAVKKQMIGGGVA
ncbi:hypothetical protein ACFWO6_28910 [Paenibacillus glucanolyticus]|uniref:hypothetical protein n=2 Tax=Paenibacillus glucanolyticus TaxID=59843 RepID=UPI00364E07AE